MNDYLIPANSKKSQLIFSIFRPVDLLVFGIGIAASLLLMFVFKGDSVSELVIKLAPAAVTGMLVMPMPYYHNIMVFLREAMLWFTGQKRYLWRGWCAGYATDDKEN